MGLFRGSVYRERVVELAAGDVLVFYTDGLTEAGDVEKEPFGMERLAEAVARRRDLSSREICRQVMLVVEEFAGEDAFADDRTLVILRVL